MEVVQGSKMLVVHVIPSLALVSQQNSSYLGDEANVLSICSLKERKLKDNAGTDATIDVEKIGSFIRMEGRKITCVTYKSYQALMKAMGETEETTDVCNYDEAHNAVAEGKKELICGGNTHCEKQIFFTATPKNDNGIVMFDLEDPEVSNDCGPLAFNYTFLDGLREDILNDFEIRITFSSENTNNSMYEDFARAVLTTGNSRVLTFHLDTESENDTSVSNFCSLAQFKKALKKVASEDEFVSVRNKYTKVSFEKLTCETPSAKRIELLGRFDTTTDDEIFIISSCRTVGEGVDTKKANMVVFVDPKQSYVQIIQNIGRVLRKNSSGIPSTVLIPCHVDKEKCHLEDTKEEHDRTIREVLDKGGHFNGILNVTSALRQEDDEIYESCLNHPNSFSPKEIKDDLRNRGFIVNDGALDLKGLAKKMGGCDK